MNVNDLFDSPYENILFDLDGTLIDSYEVIKSGLKLTLDHFNIDLKFDIGNDFVGPPLAEAFATLTNNADEEIIILMVDYFKKIYDRDLCNLSQPFSYVDKLLLTLSTKKRLFLITNKREIPTKKILFFRNWQNLFVDYYCIDTFTNEKYSKPDLINKMINSYNLNKKSCIYVGDHSHDRIAANAANISFLKVINL